MSDSFPKSVLITISFLSLGIQRGRASGTLEPYGQFKELGCQAWLAPRPAVPDLRFIAGAQSSSSLPSTIPFGNYADLCKLFHKFKKGSCFRQFFNELSNCQTKTHLPAGARHDLWINNTLPYNVRQVWGFFFFFFCSGLILDKIVLTSYGFQGGRI